MKPVSLIKTEKPKSVLHMTAICRYTESLCAGSPSYICQYIQLNMCIISFAGSRCRKVACLNLSRGMPHKKHISTRQIPCKSKGTF